MSHSLSEITASSQAVQFNIRKDSHWILPCDDDVRLMGSGNLAVKIIALLNAGNDVGVRDGITVDIKCVTCG